MCPFGDVPESRFLDAVPQQSEVPDRVAVQLVDGEAVADAFGELEGVGAMKPEFVQEVDSPSQRVLGDETFGGEVGVDVGDAVAVGGEAFEKGRFVVVDALDVCKKPYLNQVALMSQFVAIRCRDMSRYYLMSS